MPNNRKTAFIWWAIAIIAVVALYFWFMGKAPQAPQAPVNDTTGAIQGSLQDITIPSPDQGTQAVDKGINAL